MSTPLYLNPNVVKQINTLTFTDIEHGHLIEGIVNGILQEERPEDVGARMKVCLRQGFNRIFVVQGSISRIYAYDTVHEDKLTHPVALILLTTFDNKVYTGVYGKNTINPVDKFTRDIKRRAGILEPMTEDQFNPMALYIGKRYTGNNGTDYRLNDDVKPAPTPSPSPAARADTTPSLSPLGLNPQYGNTLLQLTRNVDNPEYVKIHTTNYPPLQSHGHATVTVSNIEECMIEIGATAIDFREISIVDSVYKLLVYSVSPSEHYFSFYNAGVHIAEVMRYNFIGALVKGLTIPIERDPAPLPPVPGNEVSLNRNPIKTFEHRHADARLVKGVSGHESPRNLDDDIGEAQSFKYTMPDEEDKPHVKVGANNTSLMGLHAALSAHLNNLTEQAEEMRKLLEVLEREL